MNKLARGAEAESGGKLRLRRIKDMREYTIDAADTDIGRVRGLFFDDLTWTIRYIVVAASTVLSGKELLLSTAALKKRAWSPLHIRVNLNWKQVESAPGVDLRQPISRKGEIEQHNHYGWPHYWEGEDGQNSEAHLRNSEEVSGYKVTARDGEIGRVDDFLFDDKSWKIRWAIINTDGWWSGKRVLMSPRWIREVNWRDRRIHVGLSREQVKKSPEWNPEKPVSRKYELELHKHYQLPPYWISLKSEPEVEPGQERST
ncbi:MAG: PRC-barrel domain-containing protein [Candidatus Acidiferrales bacterium]